MTEKLIPLLRNIKTKEPSVALAALAVYAEMGKRLGHDIIASDILPALWPMAVGVLLNMDQVSLSLEFLTLVQSIIRDNSRTGKQSCPTTNAKVARTRTLIDCLQKHPFSHARKSHSRFYGRNYSRL